MLEARPLKFATITSETRNKAMVSQVQPPVGWLLCRRSQHATVRALLFSGMFFFLGMVGSKGVSGTSILMQGA